MRDSAHDAKQILLGAKDEFGGDRLVFWFTIAGCCILILNGWF